MQQPLFLVALGLIVLSGFVFLVARQLRPARVLEKRQAALIEGIEKRNAARIRRLVAEDYADVWGFTREDIVTTMVDGGSQFLVLTVLCEDETMQIEGAHAEISARLILQGTFVGPGGAEVMRHVNQLRTPFRFIWKKKSFLPSSWHLERVENRGLPDDLYGYEPGDFRRAMRGE